MKKTILVLSALSVYLFACEKEEESEQSKMLKQIVGTYTNGEVENYFYECRNYACDWYLYYENSNDEEFNFEISKINDDKIEIIFFSGGKLFVEDFEQLSNAISGKILLQNQNWLGEIQEIKGYDYWVESSTQEGFSFSYDNNIVDFYFIVEDAMLVHIQAIKE